MCRARNLRMASAQNKADATDKGGNNGSWLMNTVSHTAGSEMIYLHGLPNSSLRILCLIE